MACAILIFLGVIFVKAVQNIKERVGNPGGRKTENSERRRFYKKSK